MIFLTSCTIGEFSISSFLDASSASSSTATSPCSFLNCSAIADACCFPNALSRKNSIASDVLNTGSTCIFVTMDTSSIAMISIGSAIATIRTFAAFFEMAIGISRYFRAIGSEIRYTASSSISYFLKSTYSTPSCSVRISMILS